VQFDYVRFPDGAPAGAGYDGRSDQAGRIASITDFLAQARARLEPMGCATAADIFGWITNTTGDGGIGQQLESIAGVVDVISPMIYPSHYSPGWYGFEVPNDHPGPVVTNATNDALRRMAGSQAVLRPWLQDFWYTPTRCALRSRRSTASAPDGCCGTSSASSRVGHPPIGRAGGITCSAGTGVHRSAGERVLRRHRFQHVRIRREVDGSRRHHGRMQPAVVRLLLPGAVR
jgi:hypothetical protein